jgi:hypothetical protein
MRDSVDDIELKATHPRMTNPGMLEAGDYGTDELVKGKKSGCCCGCRERLRELIGSVWLNGLVIITLLGWLVLILLELFFIGAFAYEDYVRVGLHVFFAIEVILRILACDWSEEYNAGYLKWYILDFLFLVAAIALDVEARYSFVPVKISLLITLCVNCGRIAIRLYVSWFSITKAARRLVGGRKRRYQKGGFDLDLTYIEPQLIAMGLPSTGGEGLYRNPLSQVSRFFNTLHKDKYRIYNLCDERDYPEEGFNGRVRRMGFDDHNPPPLSLLVRLVH